MEQQSVSSVYRVVSEKIMREVGSLTSSELEGTTVDKWVGYLMQKYAYEPIEFEDVPYVVKDRIDKYVKRGQIRDIEVEVPRALIGLPIVPNSKIEDLIKMRGDSWIHQSTEYEYRDGYIFLLTDTESDKAQRAIDTFKKNIRSLNQSIEQSNVQLRQYIEGQIHQRMDILGTRTETFKTLAEALGAELELTQEKKRTLAHIPQVKQSIQTLRRPQPQHKGIPRMEPEVFQTIVDVIEGQATSFERTPKTLAKLDEPEIRNLILANLNGAFNLGATGETFSNRGKTDIYLPVPEGGIFIAECKIWGGSKTMGEAIDQILGYLTWRDAYGLVLVFSRNKGFSGVLEGITATIRNHSSLRGEVHRTDEHHWNARHVLKENGQELVEMHYLAYNICA